MASLPPAGIHPSAAPTETPIQRFEAEMKAIRTALDTHPCGTLTSIEYRVGTPPVTKTVKFSYGDPPKLSIGDNRFRIDAKHI